MTSSKSPLPHPTWMAYLICSLAGLFYIYDYFIQVSPAVITEQLMLAFNVSAPGLGFLGACFFYAYASMQIPAGILLDHFGARKLLSLAILISGFGVILFANTGHFYVAGLGRFLIGFGSAFAFISTLFLASHWFDHRYFALIAGCVQFGGCLGSIMGEAPLATLMNHYGWRHVLSLTGNITLVLALVYWLLIRDYPQDQFPPKPYLKASLNTEKHRLKQLFSHPQIKWIGMVGFFSWIPVATFGALWGVPYLMLVYHLKNTQAAAYCSLFWLSLGLSSIGIGWYSDHIKRRKRPVKLCFSLGLLGSLGLILAPHLPFACFILSLILLGASAATQSLTFGIMKDSLAENLFGTGSGFLNMMAIIAGGISQQLMGLLLNWTIPPTAITGPHHYHIINFQQGFLILPLGALLGWIVTSYRLKETYCQRG